MSPLSHEPDSPSQSFGPSAARSRSCEPWPFLPVRARVPLERTDDFSLLCPLLTPVPRSESLSTPSVPPRQTSVRDRAQASRGKFDRLPRTPAGSTPQALDGSGLCGQLSARPTWTACYPVSVRQVAVLVHAAFRRRLATTPLRFASTSPPSGCAGDLHPQAVEHARHTSKPLTRQEYDGFLDLPVRPCSPPTPAAVADLLLWSRARALIANGVPPRRRAPWCPRRSRQIR